MGLFSKKTDHGAVMLRHLAACEIYGATSNEIRNFMQPSRATQTALNALEDSRAKRHNDAQYHCQQSKGKFRRPKDFAKSCQKHIKHINAYTNALAKYKDCEAQGKLLVQKKSDGKLYLSSKGKKLDKALRAARAKLPRPVIAALADTAIASGAQHQGAAPTDVNARLDLIQRYERTTRRNQPGLYGDINSNVPSGISTVCQNAAKIYNNYAEEPDATFTVDYQHLSQSQPQAAPQQHQQARQQPVRQQQQQQQRAQQPVRQQQVAPPPVARPQAQQRVVQQPRVQQSTVQQPARQQSAAQRQMPQRIIKTQTAAKPANISQKEIEMRARFDELTTPVNMDGAVISPAHLQQIQASQPQAGPVIYDNVPGQPGALPSTPAISAAAQSSSAIPGYDTAPPLPTPPNVQSGSASSAAVQPRSLVAAAMVDRVATNSALAGSPFMQRPLTTTGSPAMQRPLPAAGSSFTQSPLPAANSPFMARRPNLPPPVPAHFAQGPIQNVDISRLPPAPGQEAAATVAAPASGTSTPAATASTATPKRALPTLPPRKTAKAPVSQSGIFKPTAQGSVAAASTTQAQQTQVQYEQLPRDNQQQAAQDNIVKPTRPVPYAIAPTTQTQVQYEQLPTNDQRRADQYLQGTETTSNAVARQGRYAASTATTSGGGQPPQSRQQLHKVSASAQAKAEHNATPAAPRSATTATQPGRVNIPAAFRK